MDTVVALKQGRVSSLLLTQKTSGPTEQQRLHPAGEERVLPVSTCASDVTVTSVVTRQPISLDVGLPACVPQLVSM